MDIQEATALEQLAHVAQDGAHWFVSLERYKREGKAPDINSMGSFVPWFVIRINHLKWAKKCLGFIPETPDEVVLDYLLELGFNEYYELLYAPRETQEVSHPS